MKKIIGLIIGLIVLLSLSVVAFADWDCGNHKWDSGTTTPATCTEDGKIVYVCQNSHTTEAGTENCSGRREEPIAKKGHTPGSPEKNQKTNSTYKVHGTYDMEVHCVVCDELLSTTPGEDPLLEVESILIDLSSDSIEIGESTTATATILPDAPDKPSPAWSIAENAAIDSDGNIIGTSEGLAVVTATVGSKSNIKPLTVKSKTTPSPSPAANFKIRYLPGTDCPAQQEYTDDSVGTTAYLRGQTYLKSGYTQTGWSTMQGGPKVYDLDKSYSISSNITLYPFWIKNVGTLKLTVNYSGEGVVYLNGTKVTSGAVYDIASGQSYTFTMTPNSKDYYVYSINFAGKYWNANVDTDKFMVTYDMMQAENRTLTIKFDSVTAHPKTGDDSNLLLWSCLCGLSAAAVTAGVILKKKSKS